MNPYGATMTRILCYEDSYLKTFDAIVTDVADTREVGRVRVVGHESKGRINKRLRIAVDP